MNSSLKKAKQQYIDMITNIPIDLDIQSRKKYLEKENGYK